jgi:hypothetical protein
MERLSRKIRNAVTPGTGSRPNNGPPASERFLHNLERARAIFPEEESDYDEAGLPTEIDEQFLDGYLPTGRDERGFDTYESDYLMDETSVKQGTND